MKILFLGDSLVAFYHWQARFPAHAVINGGRSGETVACLLANLPLHLRRCPDPERVFIMIGTNNLLREDYGFLPDYAKILDDLSSILPRNRLPLPACRPSGPPISPPPLSPK